MTSKTAANIQHHNIPEALCARQQWIAWTYVPNPSKPKPDKLPYDPNTGEMAKPNDPATWGTLRDTAILYRTKGLDGIGFVFSPDDPYTGIDLDGCRDPETGVIDPWAQTVIDELGSYTEVSPSLTGVHIIVEAKLPPGGRRTGHYEMYDSGRYFTVTGNHLDGTPLTIEPRQAHVEALHRRVFDDSQATPQGEEPKPRQATSSPCRSDAAILSVARSAKNSIKFMALYDDGVTTAHGGNESAADLALCGMLAFYTQDPEQLDRLFRGSALYRPKWDERHSGDGRTYGEMTIAKALKGATACYAGGQDVDTGGGCKIVSVSATEVVAMELPPLNWIIPGVLPAGLAVLGGKPKAGKSFLALGWALAVADGGEVLGEKVEQGEVLYAALEDGYRRLQDRLTQVFGPSAPVPADLHFVTEKVPRTDSGLVAALQGWLDEHPRARLIIIDTLAEVKPQVKGRQDPYLVDNACLAPLRKLAQEANIAILLITHIRKLPAEDPFDTIIGTVGTTGTADTLLALLRPHDSDKATLTGKGRDLGWFEHDLRFVEGRWLPDDAPDNTNAISAQRRDILRAVEHLGTASPSQVALSNGAKREAVKVLMVRMARDGQLVNEGGTYRLPPKKEEVTSYQLPVMVTDLAYRDKDVWGGNSVTGNFHLLEDALRLIEGFARKPREVA